MTIENTVDMDGVSVPRFFYGTAWKEDATEACVLEALRAGFRSIDTANQRKHYFEKGAGDALRAAYSEGIVSREDLFLQTKYTYQRGQDHRLPYDPDADFASQVVQSFESSLEHLGTDYIDSYILHGPYSGSGIAQKSGVRWSSSNVMTG